MGSFGNFGQLKKDIHNSNGDPEAGCKVFHVCTNDGNNGLTKQSFSCPEGTLFQQKYFVCDWSSNVDCSKTQDFYDLNNRARESRKATFEEMKSQDPGERASFKLTATKDICPTNQTLHWLSTFQKT